MPKGIYKRIIPVWNKWLTKETDERVKNISIKSSKSLSNRNLSAIHRQNIGIASKGRKFPKDIYINYGMRGKHLSIIAISKIRKSKIGTHHSLATKLLIKHKRKNQVFLLKDTSIEVKIQNFLSRLQIEFFTHQYIHIEHGYQCDIFIPAKNLIIECFGDYWHKYLIGREIDSLRCQELRAKGYKLFIFWEREIRAMELADFKNKLETIKYG